MPFVVEKLRASVSGLQGRVCGLQFRQFRQDALPHPVHVKPHGPHQCKRIAFFHYAGAEAIVEHHAAIFELVFEVIV